MGHKRLTTWQKATALVPLALLSGAWTTSIAVTSTASAATDRPTTLPDGTRLPDGALKVPASMTQSGVIAPGIPDGAAQSVIAAASTNGIPAAALAAYQRAEQVINAADASCNLPWQLVAAIGRVESDHGRYGGNTLGDDGKSRPGIYGIPLDGSNGTAEIGDTDRGDLDDDPVFDRAVGPMQFIPSTWAVVGVDGDGDGVRDPQDIDDAALASAVYLCSGDEDLATYGGQKASVYRYNHSEEYVDLVLAIMNAYLGGDYSAVPNRSAATTVFTPDAGAPGISSRTTETEQRGTGGRTGDSTGGATGGVSRPGGGGDGGGTGPGDDGGSDPDGTPPVPEEDAPEEPADKVEDTVSELDKAKQTCQETFTAAEIEDMGGLDACAQAVLDGGVAAAQDLLDALTDPVDDTVGGVTGSLP